MKKNLSHPSQDDVEAHVETLKRLKSHKHFCLQKDDDPLNGTGCFGCFPSSSDTVNYQIFVRKVGEESTTNQQVLILQAVAKKYPGCCFTSYEPIQISNSSGECFLQIVVVTKYIYCGTVMMAKAIKMYSSTNHLLTSIPVKDFLQSSNYTIECRMNDTKKNEVMSLNICKLKQTNNEGCEYMFRRDESGQDAPLLAVLTDSTSGYELRVHDESINENIRAVCIGFMIMRDVFDTPIKQLNKQEQNGGAAKANIALASLAFASSTSI